MQNFNFPVGYVNGQPIGGMSGSPGTPGADGQSATIRVGSVSAVGPNEPAEVVNVGTNTNAVFNIKIPRGQPGGDMESSIYDRQGKQVDIFNYVDNSIEFDVTHAKSVNGVVPDENGDIELSADDIDAVSFDEFSENAMKKSDYDPNSVVKNIGGIAAYLQSQGHYVFNYDDLASISEARTIFNTINEYISNGHGAYMLMYIDDQSWISQILGIDETGYELFRCQSATNQKVFFTIQTFVSLLSGSFGVLIYADGTSEIAGLENLFVPLYYSTDLVKEALQEYYNKLYGIVNRTNNVDQSNDEYTRQSARGIVLLDEDTYEAAKEAGTLTDYATDGGIILCYREPAEEV